MFNGSWGLNSIEPGYMVCRVFDVVKREERKWLIVVVHGMSKE
jgi:hypothetical protein